MPALLSTCTNAGAIYGFGPFVLGLAKYHPTAGLLAAGIPWLFCPAVFGPKAEWQWLRIPLSALPFLAILLFFQVSANLRLFAIPTQIRLHSVDLSGLMVPLIMVNKSAAVIGFYHIPIAAFVMGFSMLLAARRFGVMIILCLGTILAFCDSFLNISPIMWLAIPVLCCSVLIGAGVQGLASAGFADRRWVLTLTVIMVVLSLLTLLLATECYITFPGFGLKYAKLLVETDKMYILGTIPENVM